MKARLWAALSQEEGIRLNGPMPEDADSAPHILSLSFDGVRGEVMRNALEGEGVLVSTGSACASHKQKVSPTLRAMGLSQAQADGTRSRQPGRAEHDGRNGRGGAPHAGALPHASPVQKEIKR